MQLNHDVLSSIIAVWWGNVCFINMCSSMLCVFCYVVIMEESCEGDY